MPPMATYRKTLELLHDASSEAFSITGTYSRWHFKFETRDTVECWLFLSATAIPATVAIGGVKVQFKLAVTNDARNVCRESALLTKVFTGGDGYGVKLGTMEQVRAYIHNGKIEAHLRIAQVEPQASLAEVLIRMDERVATNYRTGLEARSRDLQVRVEQLETQQRSLREEHDTLVAVHSVCAPVDASAAPPPAKVRVREPSQMEMLLALSEKAGDSWEEPERSLALLDGAMKSCKTSMADRNTCVVCMSEARSFVYPTCGHLCVCRDCVSDESIAHTCPVCKQGDQTPIFVFR